MSPDLVGLDLAVHRAGEQMARVGQVGLEVCELLGSVFVSDVMISGVPAGKPYDVLGSKSQVTVPTVPLL